MDANQLQELEFATKNPKLVTETQQEQLDRLRAEQLYYNSGGRSMPGISSYEAGWKAAKAYYEVKQ